MMIAYRVLRGLARVALRWFYRDIEVVGIERVPATGPALLASNHPNALVDALVIGATLWRPVTLTAKATLLDYPITRAMLRLTGVVPLRRASDDAARDATGGIDPARNAGAFAAVLDALERNGMVLLFPEGKSHSDPALAPLKTGLARIALMARDERRLAQVPIVPIGLTFERKWQPRSRVVLHVGRPIEIGTEISNTPGGVVALTRRVDDGLRAVTLNFGTADEAERTIAVSAVLAEVLDEFRPLHAPDPPLARRVRLARRLGVVDLSAMQPRLAGRIERFLSRLDSFEHLARRYRVAANDIEMSTRLAPGVWFLARESMLAGVTGPLAVWGRVNHWLPLRIARRVAVRSSRAPDEPAMRTIVAGLVLVIAFYATQTVAVAWSTHWGVALLYAATLPVSATWDFVYADRRRRAVQRVRTYLLFRRSPAVRRQLLEELAWLRGEAAALDSAVGGESSRGDRR